MSKLNHTPQPWGWMDDILVGAHGRRPVVLTYGHTHGGGLVQRDPTSGLLKPFDASTPDGTLIALATTAPHDCDQPRCAGAENKRKLDAADALLSVARRALSGFEALERSRSAPATEAQRAAVAELQGLIADTRAAIAQADRLVSEKAVRPPRKKG